MKRVRDYFNRGKIVVFTWIMILTLEIKVFIEKTKYNNKYIKMIRNFIERTDKEMGIFFGICLIACFWPLKNIYNNIIKSEYKFVVFLFALIVSFILNKYFKHFDFNLKRFIRNKVHRVIVAFYNKYHFASIKKLPFKVKIANAININLERICTAIPAVICFLLILGINYAIFTFNFSNIVISLFIALHKYLILQLMIVYLSGFFIQICIFYTNRAEKEVIKM